MILFSNTRKYVEICFSGRKINPLHAIIWVDSTNVKIIPYESSKVYIGETVIPPEGAILKVGCEFAISGTKLLLANPDGSIPTNSTSSTATSTFSLVPSSKDAFVPSLRCGTLPMRPDTPTFPFSFGKDDLSVSTPILASSPLKSKSVNSNLVNDELTQFTPFEFGRSASKTNLSNSNIEDINPQNVGPLSSLDHNSVSKSSGSESTENEFKKLSMSIGPLKDSDSATVLDPPPQKKHKKPPSPPPPLSSHCSSVQNTSESQGGKDSVAKTSIDADSERGGKEEEESKISIYFFGVWALRAIKMSRKYAKVYESYFYQNKYGMSISTIENKVMNFAYKSRSEVCNDFIKIVSDSIVVNIGNQALCSLAIKFYKEVSRLFSTKGVSFTQFDFGDILNVDDNSFVTLDDFGSSRENSENEADDNDDEDNDENNNDNDIDMSGASANDNIGIGEVSMPIIGRDPIADNILKSISQGESNKPAKGDTKPKKPSKSVKEASTSIERNDSEASNVKSARSKASANVQSAYMEVEQKTHASGSKKGRKPKEVAVAQPSPLSMEVPNVTTVGYPPTQKYDSVIHRSESYEYSRIGIEYRRKKHNSKKSSKGDVSGPGTPKKSLSKLKDHIDGESVQAKSVDVDAKSPVGVKSPSKRGRKKTKGLENVKVKSGDGESMRDSSLSDGPKCEVSSTPIIDMDVEVPDTSKNVFAGALENAEPQKEKRQATNDNINDIELDDIAVDNAQKSKENGINVEKSAVEKPQTTNNNDNVSNVIAADKANDDQISDEMGISTSSVQVTENTKPHDSIVTDSVSITTVQKPEKMDMDVESAETTDSVNNQVQPLRKPDLDSEKPNAIVENVGANSEQNQENEYGEIDGIEKGSPDEFDDITFPASFLNSPQSDKSLSLSLDKSASRRMDFNDSERGEYDNGNADGSTNKNDMVVIDEQSIYAKCDENDAIKVPEDKPLSPIKQYSIKEEEEEGLCEQKESAEMNVNNMKMQKGDVVVGECDIETTVVVHNLSTRDDVAATENGDQGNTSPIDLQNDFVQSSLVTNTSSAEQNVPEDKPQGNNEQNMSEDNPQSNIEQIVSEDKPQGNSEQNVPEYNLQGNNEQNVPEDKPQGNTETPPITSLNAPIEDVTQIKDDPTDQSNISPIMCPHSDVTLVEPIVEANGIGNKPQNVDSPNGGINTNTQNDPPKADVPVPNDPPVDDMSTKPVPPRNNSPVDTDANSVPKHTKYNASEDHSLGDTIILPSSLAKSASTVETRTVDSNTQSNGADTKSQGSTSKTANFAQNSTVKFNLKPLINLDFKKEKRPADNQLQTIISNNINPALISNSLSNNAYITSNSGTVIQGSGIERKLTDNAMQSNVTSGYNSANSSQDSIVLIDQGDVYAPDSTSVGQQCCFGSGQKMETNYYGDTQMQNGAYQNPMYSQTMDYSYPTALTAGSSVTQQINGFETGNGNNGSIDPYLNMDAMNVPTQSITGGLGQGVMPQYGSYGMYTDNTQVGYVNYPGNYSGNYPGAQSQNNVVGKNVVLMDNGNMRASQPYESSQGFGVISPQNGTLNPQGNGYFVYPQQGK